MTMSDERLFKFILKCKKTSNPDLHSFIIKIDGGIAFVECRDYGEIYIDTRTSQKDGSEKREQFAGTPIAATNFLMARKADMATIEQ